MAKIDKLKEQLKILRFWLGSAMELKSEVFMLDIFIAVFMVFVVGSLAFIMLKSAINMN